MEVAGPLAVVFQKEHVDGRLVEQFLGHRLVAARRHPAAAEIAAAQVQAKGEGRRAAGGDALQQRDIGVEQAVRIGTLGCGLPSHVGIAQHGDGHLVELDVAATGLCELRQLCPINRDKVVKIGGDVRVGAWVDRLAETEEMERAGRRHGRLHQRTPHVALARSNSGA